MIENSKNKYVIVVPVYKGKLNSNELLVINNLLDLYNKENIRIVCPEGLSIPHQLQNFTVERFEKKYFKSISGYNKLLLSHEFYKKFDDFEYMLIHQLDAYLFKDELNFWCDKDYDYIGAPWLRDERILVKIFRSKKVKKRDIIFNRVGNGGLSLRKIKTFINFIENHNETIEKNIQSELYGIEDVFWSIIAPRHMTFKIPDINTAAKFALDRKPKIGMKMNGFKLPFGCHGFEKKKTKPFWQKHIKGLN